MGRKKKVYNNINEGRKFPPLVYGLEGVMAIFNVSKSTASRYVNTFLTPAVTRRDNIIMIDTRKALECFGIPSPDNFIMKDRSEERDRARRKGKSEE